MEVFLTKQCLSLTGMLGRGYGYNLRRSKNGRFFSQRCPKGIIPPDGHWRFIVTCAELAQNRLHITDIEVSRDELKTALYEAHHFNAARCLALQNYNARDIINFKITFSLYERG